MIGTETSSGLLLKGWILKLAGAELSAGLPQPGRARDSHVPSARLPGCG
jgi:hypothetical protein